MAGIPGLWRLLLYGLCRHQQPVVGVMINRWFQTRRGIATSIAVSGNATGQLVIIGVLAAFVTDIGWRRAFGALGAVNLIIAVPFCWLPSWLGPG